QATDASLTLAPSTQTALTGTQATLTAHLADAGGTPVPNITITFSAVAGSPKTNLLGTAVTDASGDAVFQYTSSADGTDGVVASARTGFDSSQAQVTWLTDTTPPVVSVPADFTVEATGPAGAVATFAVSATDPDDVAGPVACDPASGSTFPLGQTTVTCTSTDTHGNTGSASFHVTVADTTPPALDLPADFTVEQTGPDGAVVSYEASATDLVDGSVPVTCAPPSGSTFPPGQTTVAC